MSPAPELADSDPLDASVIKRVADSWPRRATVRTDLDRLAAPDEIYRPELPDYPVRLLPFAEHPLFLAAEPAQQQHVLTLAWLMYNERVIVAEEWVANPTFSMIMRGVFPGADDIDTKRAVQQTHIDEAWHTYLHLIAMQRTRDNRDLGAEPANPPGSIYRKLVTAQQQAAEPWERDLLMLAWTTVGEISVNAYLDLLSRDQTVQPHHTLVPRLHARDEAAHGSIMVEVAKRLYHRMNAEQRAAFVRALPLALDAFVSHDFAAWPGILHSAGISGAEDIVGDCEASAANRHMVRDFSGIRRIVREMEIVELDGYDFGPEEGVRFS